MRLICINYQNGTRKFIPISAIEHVTLFPDNERVELKTVTGALYKVKFKNPEEKCSASLLIFIMDPEDSSFREYMFDVNAIED